MPGIADLFAGSAPQAQPVANAMTQGNEQQAQNVLNTARQAEAASQVQDVSMKQRQMQLSMLNGVLSLPPEKQHEALSRVVPMMNRLGPTQFDESMTPETAKMYIMSQVPAQSIPEYQMMNAKANWYNSMANPQGGAVPSGQSQPAGQPPAAGTPMPQGTPMPGNGQINPSGAAPVPSGGGAPLSPADRLLNDPMASILEPQAVTAAATAKRAQYESPEGQAAIAAGKKKGENTAEAQKGALEANEGFEQVKQSIEALKNLINDTNLPQSKYGMPSKGQAWISQNFPDTPGIGDNQAKSNAYNTFQTINESQTINAIRSLAETGQIRMTRTLENIINRGYLIDPDVSPQAKLQQAQAVENELENSAIAAQNVAGKMSGGQGNTPYKAPYTAPVQNSTQQSGNVAPEGTIIHDGKGKAMVKRNGQWTPM